MLLAMAAAGLLADCVPARSLSGDPMHLRLFAGGPVNCLVVERAHWNDDLWHEGRRLGLAMLAEVDAPGAAAPAGAGGTVFFQARGRVLPANGLAPVGQGVWPGLRIDDEAVAGPTAAPWIVTNLGYLRYLRSQVRETIWLGNRPPADKPYSGRRYQQAIADAALAGARWVLGPGDDFARRLLAGEAEARREWAGAMDLLKFIESLPKVRALKTYSRLGVSVARHTGALVSGGVLDMIGAQHVPFQVVPSGGGLAQFFDFADDAVVRFPKAGLGRVALEPDDIADLEHLYRRVQVVVGRTNYGLRVFNGAAQLTAPYALPGGKGVLVLVANYTDYPVESVTLHVLGQWKKAVFECPGCEPRPLSMYPVKDATAIEIDSVPVFGAVRVE